MTPTTTTTYKVVVTTVDGCKDSVNIKIDVQPIPTGTFVVDTDTICFGTDAYCFQNLDQKQLVRPSVLNTMVESQ